MKAVFMTEPGRLEILEKEMEQPNNDEVLVKISNVCICGSDIHYYKNGKLGDKVVTDPLILGHEASGIVVSDDCGAYGYKKGDRVVIEPGVPCFSCEHCRKGKYNLCDEVKFISVPGVQGALREYLPISRHGIIKLPDSISQKDAALIEPLAVGYNAAQSVGIQAGSSICITGAGPIGLAVLESSRIMGASKIMITDADPYRLDIASSHGADLCLDIRAHNIEKEGKFLTNGKGFDFVIDASGVSIAMESCIALAAKAATVGFVGLGEEKMQLSGYELVKKQLIIKGVNRYANQFQNVINLLASGKYDLAGFISHEFKLDEIKEAFKLACSPDENKMKIIINF